MKCIDKIDKTLLIILIPYKLQLMYFNVVLVHLFIMFQIGLAVFLPILIIQNLSFITIPKKDPCQPRIQAHKPKSNKPITSCQWIFYCIYMFYRAPVTKFTIFMVRCMFLLSVCYYAKTTCYAQSLNMKTLFV